MKTIKALSVHQPWASMIAAGTKKIETRTWGTHFRGDLLICSTRKLCGGDYLFGVALAIVDLWDCNPMVADDEKWAICLRKKGLYSWFLKDIRPIKKPFSVIGRQGLFNFQLPKGVRLWQKQSR